MINPKFIIAIKEVSKRLEKNKIKWALIGSTNMQLQGIEIIPHDLDIVVQLKDLKKIPKIFSEFTPSEIKKLPPMTSKPAWEVKLNINDVGVQIMGEKDAGEYASKLLAKRLVYIQREGVDIPCFNLEAEAQAYAETNRENKALLIKNFLKKINS